MNASAALPLPGAAMSPRDTGLVILAMAVWGLNFVVAKLALGECPPLLLMALRMSLLAIVLTPFFRVPRRQWFNVAMVGVTLGGLHYALFFAGLRGMDAAVATVAAQTQVPFAALMAALVFGDYLGWRRLLGMAIAFAGVALIAGEPRGTTEPMAFALLTAGTFSWAVANVFIKKLGPINPFALNGWMALVAAPLLFAASWRIETWPDVSALGPRTWFAVIYMVFGASITAYSLWYRLIARYEVNQVVPWTLTVPVLGMFAAWLLLGEAMSWELLLGAAITMAGVAVIVLRRPAAVVPLAEVE